MTDINKKANDIPLHQQLEILKSVREIIEFCHKTGAKMRQKKLEFKD